MLDIDFQAAGSLSTYLTGRLDLERSKGRLEIWDVGFEFVKGGCNTGLELAWVGS